MTEFGQEVLTNDEGQVAIVDGLESVAKQAPSPTASSFPIAKILIVLEDIFRLLHGK